MRDFEIKSKAQLRAFLGDLVKLGKLSAVRVDEMIAAADLPEYEGMRAGKVRKQLGGRRSLSRRGKVLKGRFR